VEHTFQTTDSQTQMVCCDFKENINVTRVGIDNRIHIQQIVEEILTQKGGETTIEPNTVLTPNKDTGEIVKSFKKLTNEFVNNIIQIIKGTSTKPSNFLVE